MRNTHTPYMASGEQKVGQVAGKQADSGQAGHRHRLRAKIFEKGASALSDQEIIEMVLFAAHPRGDVKPLVKQLFKSFKTIAGILHADRQALQALDGIGPASVAQLHLLSEINHRLSRDLVKNQPILANWEAVQRYCIDRLGHAPVEQFLVLYLDNQNRFIAESLLAVGTTDQAVIYPKEIARSALEHRCHAVILVHNHPSHNNQPSQPDIQITRQIKAALGVIGVRLHDHLIVAGKSCQSFRALGLL